MQAAVWEVRQPKPGLVVAKVSAVQRGDCGHHFQSICCVCWLILAGAWPGLAGAWGKHRIAGDLCACP